MSQIINAAVSLDPFLLYGTTQTFSQIINVGGDESIPRWRSTRPWRHAAASLVQEGLDEDDMPRWPHLRFWKNSANAILSDELDEAVDEGGEDRLGGFMMLELSCTNSNSNSS